MSKNILVIIGHPSKENLSKALARALVKKIQSLDESKVIKIIELSKLKFDPILHEGYNVRQKLEPDLIQAQQLITWANHLVIIYPTWWGNLPALLKGFIDRVFLPHFAFRYKKNSLLPLPEQLLKGKQATIIALAGGPIWVYKILTHPGNLALKRFTMRFCGFSKVKTNVLSNIDKLKNSKNKNKNSMQQLFKKIERIARRI